MPSESYEIGKVIGKGSYGQVSLARHKRDKKQYVIKKIDLHEASEKERTFAQQEVQILAKLKHPNIVSYKESFQSLDGFLHIVMGYCEGGDLYTKLKEHGKRNEFLSERQIVEWFVQIAMALQYMHDRNILHRDLKTQNIFLTKSKIIKIGDLGIARVLENTSDMATTLIGTPYYMSPELFSNKPYNHRSDVWALGCCVYEMATLKHAFNARDMNALVYKILKGKMPSMPKKYSEELCEIIKSMLAYNPSERPSASKILRHSFIKKHIAVFLEGTKSRKQEREKGKRSSVAAKPAAVAATDSGYIGSSELNAEAIATASGIDLDIMNDERKDKYVVPEEDDQQQEEKPKHEKVAKTGSKERRKVRGSSEEGIAKRTDPEQSKHKEADKLKADKLEARQGNDQPSISKDSKQKAEDASSRENNKKLEKKLIRVRSADDQGEKLVKRSSGKNRKNSGAHSNSPFDKPIPVKNPRPLPPKPNDGSPNFQGRERSLTDPECSGLDVPGQVALPQACVGVPNISARQKRRLRMKEEVYPPQAMARRSSKKQDHEKSSDSVDGTPRSQSSISDDDSNSECDYSSKKRDAMTRLNSPSGSERRNSEEIGELIGTMQATLNLDPRPRSAQSPTSSPEESFANIIESSDHQALSSTLSGRLNDRIERLRRECIRGVGERVLRKAFEILDTEDDHDLENAFIALMGQTKFELFGDAMRQLKFCEEFAQHSL